MDLTFTVGVVGAVAASVAAVAGIGSWRAGNRAAALTKIEQERRHAELAPQFKLELKDPGMTRTMLTVSLEGPAALDHLDSIELTIRDDMPDRAELTAGHGVSAEEIRRQIWGPLRFVHGVDGGSQDGRTVGPFSLPVGESRPFAVDATVTPHWQRNPQTWRDQWEGARMRLTLVCRRDGFEPWTVKAEVPLNPSPRYRSFQY